MARGRNQNRERNQDIKNTQLKNFPLNQQEQQQVQQYPQLLPQSVCLKNKQSNIKATNNTTTKNANTTTNPQKEYPNVLTNAPVANINRQQCNNCQSCCINETTTKSPSINFESYGHNNKTINKTIENKRTESNNNYDANYMEANGGVVVEELNTHLETFVDPAKSSTTTNTTYQMTMSNNSSENFSKVKTDDDDADSHNEDHNNDDVLYYGKHNSANERSAAHNFQQSDNETALNNGTKEEYDYDDDDDDDDDDDADGPETIFNRSPVIGQNGCVIASITENNNGSNKRLTATLNGNSSINGKLNELTECDSESLLLENLNQSNIDSPSAMGQKHTKNDNTNTSSTHSPSPSKSNRTFREPSISSSCSSLASSSSHYEGYAGNTTNHQRVQSPTIYVPTITVEDCSSVGSQQTAKSYDSNKTDKDEFFYFENEAPQQQEFSEQNNENNEQEHVDGAVNSMQKNNSSYGMQRSVSPTSMYSRYNYMKLEDVREEEEEEEEDDDDDDDDDEDSEDVDEQEEHREHTKEKKTVYATREQQNLYNSCNNLDNEYRQNKHSNSLSPESRQQHQKQQQQQQLHTKSTNINISNCNNNSDCNNLSTSFPDSGMGESLTSTTTNSRYININDTDCDAAASSSSSSTMKQQQKQEFDQRDHDLPQHLLHMPFVRDGYSTDCDETLMQCDELQLDFAETNDYLDPTTSSERLVCIESISLPDVVVESTNSNNAISTHNNNNNNSNAATSSLLTSSLLSTSLVNSGVDRDYININGATGATINSVHFIPIQIDGGYSNNNSSWGSGGGSGRSSPRKQSVDDSLVGSSRATIEIIEDATELQQHSPAITRTTKNNSDNIAEKLKNDLLEQKAQFNVQLEDAHKNVKSLQTKISEMQIKIEKLDQELSAKTWNVERLQGELIAAHKDDEYLRKKLKLLEDEKTNLRHRFSENEDEMKQKCDDLELQYNELQEKYKQTQSLASSLHTQLAKAQTEAEEWREEVDKIRAELEEQIRILQNSLQNSENERKICEDKWQREFEMLRTHNMDREESIMTDCEWQLRQMQKQCKEKIDKAETGRRNAADKVEELEEELEERHKEIDDLKIYQTQMTSLRGVVNEQERSIQNLVSQIEHLKSDLAIANENLAEQIEAVKKIKYHCDNALYDKDRQMMYRIDEVRNEAASFWEDKLYTEMTRLKNELESVYVDERREALDKLQAEHVEELKVLTNRYCDNEEELRIELDETQDRLEQKAKEFMELREKSDSALLQTRMHLDRADREFQRAMCQEEERREALENSLREEFEREKHEMEEKFRERLGQVKDEFSKELQINTQELREEQEKEIEKLKAKMQTEKDEALHALSEKHRKKLADVNEKIKDIEQRHKNDLKDLKAAYDAEKVALDKRDISNANEIEQLHRKCRCLTNLFEEMRMRYERRDPRQEDLREIEELRARCESQERDLYLLTDRLREMQIQMNELQQNGVECNAMNNKNNKKSKQIKKPPPKTIPTNCDVIYEENEERESPPPPSQNSINSSKNQQINNNKNCNHNKNNNNNNNDNNDDDHESDNDDIQSQEDVEVKTSDRQVNNGVKEQRKSKTNQSSYEKKHVKLLIKDNEDDTHMITAV